MAYFDTEKVSREIESYFGSEDENKKIKQAAILIILQMKWIRCLSHLRENLKEFITFLRKPGDGRFAFDRGNGIVIADENKPFCVCPLDDRVRCRSCAVAQRGFAEMMFSRGFGRHL